MRGRRGVRLKGQWQCQSCLRGSRSVCEPITLSHRMTRQALLAPLLLLLGLLVHSSVSQEEPAAELPAGQASGGGAQAEDEAGDWGLDSLRGGFESIGTYFDSVLEFMGGRDGVCQHRCRFGKSAQGTVALL